MYIDTNDKESIIKSICQIFKISQFELQDQLYKIDKATNTYDELCNMLDKFIDERLIFYPDEILFFHLSRRLHGMEDDVEGRNLVNLLTTENDFSNFLKKSGLEFVKGTDHIEVLYNGKMVDWDKYCIYDTNCNINYMKLRLGFFKNRKDFCFNGFFFKDLLYKNDYARRLFYSPEFLDQLTECLGCENIRHNYENNSAYYCYEYKIPLKYLILDGHDNYSYNQKQKYLIRCTLLRVNQYNKKERRYLQDDDNPILRLPDNYILPSKYFVKHELITQDMLYN